jgi:hypothetical protein
MKVKHAGVLVLLGLLFVRSVAAQSGGGFNLGWSSINGGGGVSSGGEFTLRGTVGQPDADVLSGGGYTLAGGFWERLVSGSVVVSPPGAAPYRNYFTIRRVTLTWNPISDAIAYQVQVSRNTDFTSVVYTSPELSAATLFDTTAPLDNNTYYWHVRVKHRNGIWSAWSAYESFVVNAP